MSEEIQRSALERLPLEIKSAILAALPDVQSLRSAVLTGRELYCSFKADEASIVRQILSQQIQRGVLEDAVAVLEAKSAERAGWNLEQIELLFTNYHCQTDTFLQAGNLHRALELVRFHQLVQDFSRHLAEQAMHFASMRYPREDEHPAWVANQEELVRIERSFYRFELYCVFFGKEAERLIQPGDGQREAFWDRFAPWEIEQLACVYEHLYQETSSAFEQLAMTVPEWTESAVITHSLTDGRDNFIPAQMTLGLEHIRKIQASGNNTSMIDHSLPRPYESGHFWDFDSIGPSLNQAIRGGFFSTLHEMEQNPETASEGVKPPFLADPDGGPETVWRWAHRDITPSGYRCCGYVLGDTQVPLRECGYVFWNRARLEDWQLFDRPWEGPDLRDIRKAQSHKEAEFKQILEEKLDEWIRVGAIRDGIEYLARAHNALARA